MDCLGLRRCGLGCGILAVLGGILFWVDGGDGGDGRNFSLCGHAWGTTIRLRSLVLPNFPAEPLLPDFFARLLRL